MMQQPYDSSLKLKDYDWIQDIICKGARRNINWGGPKPKISDNTTAHIYIIFVVFKWKWTHVIIRCWDFIFFFHNHKKYFCIFNIHMTSTIRINDPKYENWNKYDIHVYHVPIYTVHTNWLTHYIFEIYRLYLVISTFNMSTKLTYIY